MKKLTDVCNIIYGYAFDSKRFNISKGIPVIRIRDVVRGYTETFTDEEVSEEYYIENNDLLVGMDGEFNIGSWKGGHALLNQRVCKLVPGKSVSNRYLYHFMPHVLKEIEENTSFVTVKHLSAKHLNSIEFPDISLLEQQKIAAHLDSIQSAIDNKKQQLQQLDELVKSKFVEMFGDVKEQVSIKEICDVSGGYSFKSGDISENSGIRILQIGNVALNDVSWEVTNYLPKDFEKKYESFLLKKDDIVMALTRPIIQSLGNVKTSLVKSTDLPCLLNQRVGKIRAKFGINIRFVYYCFMQHSFTDYVQSCCKGSSQPNMSTKDIENYEIPKVDINLQNTFAEYVQKIDSAKSIIKTQLNDLNELLESKMDFYFGE